MANECRSVYNVASLTTPARRTACCIARCKAFSCAGCPRPGTRVHRARARGRHREMRQECLDLRRPHVPGASLVVMQHKAPDPVHIRLLRPYAIVLPLDPVPEAPIKRH